MTELKKFADICHEVHLEMAKNGWGITGAGGANWALIFAITGEKCVERGVNGLEGVFDIFDALVASDEKSQLQWILSRKMPITNMDFCARRTLEEFYGAATCSERDLPKYMGTRVGDMIAKVRFGSD